MEQPGFARTPLVNDLDLEIKGRLPVGDDEYSFISLDREDDSLPQRTMNWIIDTLAKHRGSEMQTMMAIINALCYHIDTDEKEKEFIAVADKFITEQALLNDTDTSKVQ